MTWETIDMSVTFKINDRSATVGQEGQGNLSEPNPRATEDFNAVAKPLRCRKTFETEINLRNRKHLRNRKPSVDGPLPRPKPPLPRTHMQLCATEIHPQSSIFAIEIPGTDTHSGTMGCGSERVCRSRRLRLHALMTALTGKSRLPPGQVKPMNHINKGKPS